VAYLLLVPRTFGARLAVPLLTILILGGQSVVAAAPIDGCRPTPTGIDCGFGGTTTSTTIIPGPTLPPLRYLAVSNGTCWYWSRYPPGFDSWDSANDQSIILTRFRLPQCTGRPNPGPVIITSERAWEILRSFPLGAPDLGVSPVVGITNLPSRLHLATPVEFDHSEVLPDGRTLEVEARVAMVWIHWGDDSPTFGATPPSPFGDPGPVRYTFALKTCPPAYRTGHLDGPKCHPDLEAYPVTVVFEWQGRYRAGAGWIHLGSIDRSSHIDYDVDEVLGVLVAP